MSVGTFYVYAILVVSSRAECVRDFFALLLSRAIAFHVQPGVGLLPQQVIRGCPPSLAHTVADASREVALCWLRLGAGPGFMTAVE